MKVHSAEIYVGVLAENHVAGVGALGEGHSALWLSYSLAHLALTLEGSRVKGWVGLAIFDFNLLIVRQRANLRDGKEFLFVRCKIHIVVALIVAATDLLALKDIVRVLPMLIAIWIQVVFGLVAVGKDLLDDFSDLVFGLDCLRSLLLYTVDAASLLVKLDESLSS